MNFRKAFLFKFFVVFTMLFVFVSNVGYSTCHKNDSIFTRCLEKGILGMDTCMPLIYQVFIESDHDKCRLLHAKSASYIARFYRDKGEYKKSLEYALISKNNFEILGDTSNAFRQQNNIASLYYAINNYQKALENSLLASSYFERVNDSAAIVYCLVTQGLCLAHLDKVKEAKLNLVKGYKFFKRNNDEIRLALTLNNLALIYKLEEKWDSVFYCRSKALEIRLLMGDKVNIMDSHMGLSRYFIEIDDYRNAKIHADSAYIIAKKVGRKSSIVKACSYLNEIYHELGDVNNAYKYLKEGKETQDSINFIENRSIIDFVILEHEMENIELENDLLRKDKTIQDSVIEKQRLIYVFLTVIILVLMLIVFQQFRNRGKMQSLNKSLTLQKDEMLKKKNELYELNKLKDRVFSTISHDLRAPITSVKGILVFIKKGYVEVDELPTLLNKAEKQVVNILETMDNLLSWAKNQMSGTEFHPEKENIVSLVTSVVNSFADDAQRKEIGLQLDSKLDELTILADVEMLKSVFRNLISNALKFTHKGGDVLVQIDEFDDQIRVSVKDSGVGISKDKQQKLFVESNGISTSGTDNEKGTGLGLSLSYEFVKLNGGDLLLESEEGVGSVFKVYLPKVKKNARSMVLTGIF